jgi:hypothetical protein
MQGNRFSGKAKLSNAGLNIGQGSGYGMIFGWYKKTGRLN